MRGSEAIIKVFVFTLGLNLVYPSLESQIKDATVNLSSNFKEVFNSTFVHSLAENSPVKSFLKSINDATMKILSDVDDHASQMSKPFKSVTTLRGAGAVDFLFSASIVKESAAKVLSSMNNTLRKVELVETEKRVRQFAARLNGEGNKSIEEAWVNNKAEEIAEDVLNLKVRLAVAESFHLFDRQAKVSTRDGICQGGFFSCATGLRNITCAKYCNGFSECQDESDEPKGCQSLYSANCLGKAFRCDSGECIPLDCRCGTTCDCHDGSQNDYCTIFD